MSEVAKKKGKIGKKSRLFSREIYCCHVLLLMPNLVSFLSLAHSSIPYSLLLLFFCSFSITFFSTLLWPLLHNVMDYPICNMWLSEGMNKCVIIRIKYKKMKCHDMDRLIRWNIFKQRDWFKSIIIIIHVSVESAS